MLLHYNDGLDGKCEVIKTEKFPLDYENKKRAGAQIIAVEGDDEFMACLQRHPKEFAFHIRVGGNHWSLIVGSGGNLYIRGGDRIDYCDPAAVQCPCLSRRARKQFLEGSKKEIIRNAQQAEDNAANQAAAAGRANQWNKVEFKNSGEKRKLFLWVIYSGKDGFNSKLSKHWTFKNWVAASFWIL